MQDIAGLRIMVQFVDDVEEILRGSETTAGLCAWSKSEITSATEIKWLPELPRRGQYPVDTIDGNETRSQQGQIPDLIHEFWATISYSLNYKYRRLSDEIKKRLETTAEPGLSLG